MSSWDGSLPDWLLGDICCAFSLQHGACVNAMDLWQFTPLHEAASKNRVEVCSLLLSHGADPTLLNCHSKSAVDMAPTPELKERLTCKFSLSHQTKTCIYTMVIGKILTQTQRTS